MRVVVLFEPHHGVEDVFAFGGAARRPGFAFMVHEEDGDPAQAPIHSGQRGWPICPWQHPPSLPVRE
jgi:hypothetical protein